MRTFIALGLLFGFASTAAGAEAVNLTKTSRKSPEEPTYTSKQPLYALAVFGKEAKTRVWFVLDQSKPGDGPYDVLHVDLNADGDLTDAGERIKASSASKRGSELVTSAQFTLGDFTDPATGDKHTDLKLRLSGGSRPSHMISLKWRDKHRMGGGYAEQSAGGYMRFAASAKEAPIVWFNGDGPFQFQRWYSESLRIGQADDLKLFLGQLGVGKNTFCAFSEHFLPEGEGVKATLIYADSEGKEHRVTYELNDRC